MESKSAVLEGPEVVNTREFELPSVGNNQAILEVELGGVCGSDAKAYTGMLFSDNIPMILGHEILGHIRKIGSSAREKFGVNEGDRVLVEGRIRCGQCKYCLEGSYQFCEEGGNYGSRPLSEAPGLWGCHGDYMYLEEGTVVHKISEDIPAEAAVLSCAVTGNSIKWLQAGADNLIGKSIVIQGPGPQGLSMTIVADSAGLSPIVVTGLPGDESRLSLAQQLGADYTICAPPDELAQRTVDTLGKEPDIVVNLTGNSDSVQQSIDLISPTGTIVFPNVSGGESTVRLDDLVLKGATLKGILSRTASEVEQAIRFIEQDPHPFTKIISHTFSVDEAEHAYRIAGGMEDEMPLKVAIDPTL